MGSHSSMQLVLTALLASGLGILSALPHGSARPGVEGSRRRRSDDFVVIEAEEPRQGRVLISDTPVDSSAPGVANFRLPLPQPDDAVVIEAGGDEEAAGRFLSDIPRDVNFGSQAGPRLPIPDTFDDFEVVEAGDYDEAGRSLSDIPTDSSLPGDTGFRLPVSDVVVVEVGTARQAQEQLLSNRDRSDCFKPLKRSRCRALLSFWFFNNHSKSCQEYKFGGCDQEEHTNRFTTEEECKQVCASGRV